jgi:hypothetical protein
VPQAPPRAALFEGRRGGTAPREAGLLRLTELLLFLAPFAAFAAWWLSASVGGPSRPVVIGAVCVLAVLAIALFWLRRENSLPSGGTYVPAELEDGRVVPGHALPKNTPDEAPPK